MILYVSLLNIFIAILLINYNWNLNRSSLYLGMMLVISSMYTLGYHWGVIREFRVVLALFWGNLSPLWYLGGPLMYFYVRGILRDHPELVWKDIYHFIPALISLVGVLPYWVTPFQQKIDFADAILNDYSIAVQLSPNWIIPVKWHLLIRPGLVISYALASIRMVFLFEARHATLRSIPIEQWRIIRNWLLILTGTVLLANTIALSISLYFNNQSIEEIQMMDQAIHQQIFFQLLLPHGYVLGFLPIAFLLFPQILFGIPIYRTSRTSNKNLEADQHEHGIASHQQEILNLTPNPNYAKGELPLIDPFQELGNRIISIMKEQKPFTDPDFSLDDLADMLDVPKHHLYYCFRKILHTKFNQFRLDYRIEYAKDLLASADLQITTLEAIGKEAGFASKSAFYSNFKEIMGCSPGEYAEIHNQREK